jgi:transcriptional regulator with XRE-family HTH domain
MRATALRLYLRSIAANVRAFRIRRGLTQEALAERADLDLSYEQRVERAATNLSVRVLVALAVALGIAPGRLLRRTKLRSARPGRPRKLRSGKNDAG